MSSTSANLPSAGNRQNNRLLTLSFPNNDGPDEAELYVNKLDAWEAMSKDFKFKVELISTSATLSLKKLMGKMMCVTMVRGDGSLRYFTGYIFKAKFVKADGDVAIYQVVLRPWLYYLKARKNCYIFNNATLSQQADTIFNAYNIRPDWKMSITVGQDTPMTCAIQFNESDHNYLHRRWEAAGWSYYYVHTQSGHQLVILDDTYSVPSIEGAQPDIPYHQGGSQEEDGISDWSAELEVGPGKHTLTSYDFKDPPSPGDVQSTNTTTSTQQGDAVAVEVHEYEGAYGLKDAAQQKQLINLRAAESDAHAKHIEAESNCRYVIAGSWFTLSNYFNQASDKSNDQYIVIEATHRAANNYLPEQGGLESYTNTFVCSRRKVAWHPGRGYNSTDTKIYGVQTATVVSNPSTGVIFVDEYGRVKVRFHWDRVSPFNDGASAFILVSSAWAGSEMGVVGMLRENFEAIIHFLGGDPDRPVITGCIHGKESMPPWKLPDQHSLLGWRSRELTATGGNTADGRSNHMILDDTQGEIQAQLKSDHQHSQLSLGYITRIEDNAGRKDARGQGFELRSDGRGVVRSAGMLITTETRTAAKNHITDMAETVQQLTVGRDQQETMAEMAKQYGAQEGSDQQSAVANAIKAQNATIKGSGTANPQAGTFPELEQPHLVLSSPAGIHTTTPKSTHIASGEHLALSSTDHTAISAKGFFASIGETIRLFVQKAGMKLIAAGGDIDMQALQNNIKLLAKLQITETAEQIIVTGTKSVMLNGGGSYLELKNGTVTLGTSQFNVLANMNVSGPSQKNVSMPPPPQNAPGVLNLFHQYADKNPIANAQYAVTDALGSVTKGTLDAKGFASVPGLGPGPVNVFLGQDPRNPWEDSSQLKKLPWPPTPPQPQAASADPGALMQAAGSGASALKNLVSKLGSAIPGAAQLSSLTGALSNPGAAMGMLGNAVPGMSQLSGLTGAISNPAGALGMLSNAVPGISQISSLAGAISSSGGAMAMLSKAVPGLSQISSLAGMLSNPAGAGMAMLAKAIPGVSQVTNLAGLVQKVNANPMALVQTSLSKLSGALPAMPSLPGGMPNIPTDPGQSLGGAVPDALPDFSSFS